jgi:hypothetical protein
MQRRVPLFALMLAGCTLAQADVFRWVDDHGVPHYSDQWVPGSEVIKTAKAHPESAGFAVQSSESRSAQAAKTAAQLNGQENKTAVQQDVAKTRAAQCKRAQEAYTDSVTHRRVYKTDATGARNYLSDADIDAYREQTRKAVQDLCGSVPVIDPNQPIEPQPLPEPKVNPADATSE